MSNNLGKIKKINLREIWKNEAYDFTKWLAMETNLSLLSEEIGIDIKLIKTEAEVGGFSVDILAEDEDDQRKIIIENQLETTDHNHLGKLITYASGYEANVVIWIFKDIREEHRQAIDWLNENTNEDFIFFGVQIEVWQIDNSAPAPKFKIISKPNEWTKVIKQSRSKDSLTDTKLKQLEFWTKLKDYIKENNKSIRMQSPRAQHWYNFNFGSSEAHIALTLNTRESIMACEVYISRNKDLFFYLKNDQNNIEKELECKLNWKEADKATRIIAIKKDFDINNEVQYQEYFAWSLDKIVKFKKTFGKRIKEFK